MKKIILFNLYLSLVACSTYSKQECEEMDWRSGAERLATEGQSMSDVKSHFGEKCLKEYGVEPKNDLLELGYKTGVELFCTPNKAQEFANDGGVYKGTCKGVNEAPFLERYHTVREAHLESEISQLKHKISFLESDKNSIESQLRSAENRLSSTESSLRSCESSSH